MINHGVKDQFQSLFGTKQTDELPAPENEQFEETK